MNKDEVSLLINEAFKSIRNDNIQHIKDHEDRGIKWGFLFLIIFVIDNVIIYSLIWSK